MISSSEVALAEADLQERKAIANLDPVNAKKILVDTEVVVPLAWHVIYREGTFEGGYLTEDLVEGWIAAVNEHYNSTGITFALDSLDATENVTWFIGADPVARKVQDEMKASLRVGNASVLNIYSVGFGSRTTKELLGYSTYPWVYENSTIDDGVVILFSSLPGGTKENFDEGKTLTHEIGHWLGLYHPFEGGCTGDGDFVDDTPPQVKTTTGCPDFQDSCPGGGTDNIHNFMDYSYDRCMFEFTPGQATRVREQLLYYRNLTSSFPYDVEFDYIVNR